MSELHGQFTNDNELSDREKVERIRSLVHVSPEALFAGIKGLGCGIGVRKMAQISANITENELENIVNWRFSLEKMELPDIYRKSLETIHPASDGQKFEVRTDSLMPVVRSNILVKSKVSVHTLSWMNGISCGTLLFSPLLIAKAPMSSTA